MAGKFKENLSVPWVHSRTQALSGRKWYFRVVLAQCKKIVWFITVNMKCVLPTSTSVSTGVDIQLFPHFCGPF